MENTNNQIGKKLKELRITHGYTQDYIASNIEVKQPTYQQYESGKRRPSSTMLYRITNFYGLTTDELLKLCIPLDNEIYYDAPEMTARTLEEAELTSYGSSKRLAKFSANEKQLLYYFSKLNKDAQRDIIAYTKFRGSQT
ncbi:Transcriptional regulator, contains XRE-family HTH domain [Butyrivibrio sp. ob235]|uniref:helix-turn-helix domain-containing protein n=1 Tax=Butyrivibrio sp. ob235 TaxID=1761780 RepID=UPI0008C9C654|nr:helix-turn-helix transcriptional regulator [Butyrivibrio sp. ob235]SEK70731.1 Transcriptional regulator, contains XRE-family HTH domain [Butyrivibrio sp. ob235]